MNQRPSRYRHEADAYIHSLVYVSSSIIETIDINSLVEEIWLTKDQSDAEYILENYFNIISDSSKQMLEETILGIKFENEYSNSKFESIQIYLDKIFRRFL